MFSSFFLWWFLDFCAVEFSLHDRHGKWYGEGRDRCFLIINCCCCGWFRWFFGCWRNNSLLGGCRKGWWRVWAAPVVVGAAFSRKFSLISLTNSSIAITSSLICLLGIILELSFNSCKYFSPGYACSIFLRFVMKRYLSGLLFWNTFRATSLYIYVRRCLVSRLYKLILLFFFPLRGLAPTQLCAHKMSTFSIYFSFNFFFSFRFLFFQPEHKSSCRIFFFLFFLKLSNSFRFAGESCFWEL